MRRCLTFFLAIIMLFTIVGCGDEPAKAPAIGTAPAPEASSDPQQTTTAPTATIPSVTSSPAVSTDDPYKDLETAIDDEVEAVLNSLYSDWETIEATFTDYDAYIRNVSTVEAFYQKILEQTNALSIKMRTYSLDYADLILSLEEDMDEMYDQKDLIYDVVYEDMGDEIYDEIYDGVLDDMYDAIYDGVLDDEPDNVAYKDWSNTRSDAYDIWSDTRSDVYDAWSDARSDVYDFWSDLSSDLWDEDLDAAKETAEKYRKDVNNLISGGPAYEITEDVPSMIHPEDLSFTSVEALETAVEADVQSTLGNLTAQWEALKSEISTYDTYVEKQASVEAFYQTLCAANESLCLRMHVYSLYYAGMVLDSGKEPREMYEDIDDLRDFIYEDMGKEIKKGIYEGILEDMKNIIYEDVLDDRPDGVAYKTWSDLRSDAYNIWSDSRSETYEQWSDFRSDEYEFCSDLRGALWDKDMEDARETVSDFREDVEKMIG